MGYVGAFPYSTDYSHVNKACMSILLAGFINYTDFHRLMIYIIDNKIKKFVLIRVICGEINYCVERALLFQFLYRFTFYQLCHTGCHHSLACFQSF